jgi:hypothetical protein
VSPLILTYKWPFCPKEQGTSKREEGTAKKEQATRKREEGTGKKEQATGKTFPILPLSHSPPLSPTLPLSPPLPRPEVLQVVTNDSQKRQFV